MPTNKFIATALAATPPGTDQFHVFCGIDWAEAHHDWAIITAGGKVLGQGRIPDTLAGYEDLLGKLDKLGGGAPVPVAIETDHGLLVAELRRTHHEVYPLNPRVVKAYRTRHGVSGAKSDKADALLMAHIGRTDLPFHRPLSHDTDGNRALGRVARAHQDAIWEAKRKANEVRSLLREFYAGALDAFDPTALASMVAIEVLRAAPTPASAAALRPEDLETVLERAGRQRGIAKAAQHIHGKLTAPAMRTDPDSEAAYGKALIGLLESLAGAVRAADTLEAEVGELVAASRIAPLVDSIPGMGAVLAARIFGEIGDDPNRFAAAANLRAYCGTAPVTSASGRHTDVHQRRATNKRLKAACWQWAFLNATHTLGGQMHYNQRRQLGDKHGGALLHLANKLVAGLFHCLHTGELWNQSKIFGVDGPRDRSLDWRTVGNELAS